MTLLIYPGALKQSRLKKYLHPVLISLACVAYVKHIEYMYSEMTLDQRRYGILKCNGRACTYNEKFIFYDVKLFSKPSWLASPLDPEN